MPHHSLSIYQVVKTLGGAVDTQHPEQPRLLRCLTEMELAELAAPDFTGHKHELIRGARVELMNGKDRAHTSNQVPV